MNPRALMCIAVAFLIGTASTACSYDGASSLPLPGAVGGDDTYTISLMLPDATNLAVKETCRSNDTVVGSVESITLDGQLRARVVCRIRKSVKIPANAIATLSQTSLLGEPFVALDPPAGSEAVGNLQPGSTLPMTATRTSPDVEVVFGALSQVLNGGSLGSIETITQELNAAFASSDVGGSIDAINRVVTKLNDHRSEIAASLDSLDRLAGKLARQQDVLAEALDYVPGGLAVLSRQRTKLVATLEKLSELSGVAVPLIDAARANTVADLRHLAPVLSQLSKAGDELALSLNRIVTFPFPSNALSSIKGDYAGLYATLNVDVDLLNNLLGVKPGAGSPAALPGSVAPPGQEQDPLQNLLAPTATTLEGLLTALLGGRS